MGVHPTCTSSVLVQCWIWASIHCWQDSTAASQLEQPEPIMRPTVTDCKYICHIIRNLINASMLSSLWGEGMKKKGVYICDSVLKFYCGLIQLLHSNPAPFYSSAVSAEKFLTSIAPSRPFMWSDAKLDTWNDPILLKTQNSVPAQCVFLKNVKSQVSVSSSITTSYFNRFLKCFVI